MDIKKKVGNACRTKNQIRHSKSSGSSMEYDCQYSLSKLYSDISLTKERGFQRQYDLETTLHKKVFECKRLKGISWNQLVKFYEKLRRVAPEGYSCYILFKSNNQPCLVFHKGLSGGYWIQPFENVFYFPFEKHPSTRSKVEDVRSKNDTILPKVD